jgi:hypothetical protein
MTPQPVRLPDFCRDNTNSQPPGTHDIHFQGLSANNEELFCADLSGDVNSNDGGDVSNDNSDQKDVGKTGVAANNKN